MHSAGKEILKKYPYFLELVRNTSDFEKIFSEMKYNHTGHTMYAQWRGYDVAITIMDGDLPGYGLYFFFKNQNDLTLFKLCHK